MVVLDALAAAFSQESSTDSAADATLACAADVSASCSPPIAVHSRRGRLEGASSNSAQPSLASGPNSERLGGQPGCRDAAPTCDKGPTRRESGFPTDVAS